MLLKVLKYFDESWTRLAFLKDAEAIVSPESDGLEVILEDLLLYKIPKMLNLACESDIQGLHGGWIPYFDLVD